MKDSVQEQIDRQEISLYCRRDTDAEGLSRHFHHRHELIFITEGSAQFTILERTITADAPCLVIIGCLEQHSSHALQYPYRRYVLTLSEEQCHGLIRDPLLRSVFLHRPPHFPYLARLGDSCCQRMEALFQEMTAEYQEKGELWELGFAAALIRLLVDLYRCCPSLFPTGDSMVQTVISVQQEVSTRYAGEITLEELAQRFFVSKYHLSRAFHQITGYRFRDYLVLHRLQAAKELLLHTRMSVGEIGIAVGYRDCNHFIRIFRQREGLSPLRYRKAFLVKELADRGECSPVITAQHLT